MEEVQKHRMEHALKFQGDLDAICKDLHEIQERSGHAVVRLPPRRLEQPVRPNPSEEDR